MNKYQEALDRLLNDDYDFPHDFYEEDKATVMERDIDTLQELVDKATSKKPIIKHEKDFDDEGYSFGKIEVPYCPSCDWCLMDNTYNELGYCPYCGQPLDWSD